MRVPFPGRRGSAAIAAASACAVTLLTHTGSTAQPVDAHRAPAALVAPLDDGGYAAVATHLQRRLDAHWDARSGRYETGGQTAAVNGDLLLVHAIAAQRGLTGPLRADGRARAIVRFLTGPQVYGERPPAGADPQVTGPGWVPQPRVAMRHPVVDTEVIDGLVHAYVARTALGLDAVSRARIRHEIHAVATSHDYAWPALRLNQINWYIEVYAADAAVNGERAALARGTGGQIARLLANAQGSGGQAGNFGPGLRFHYLPQRAPAKTMNVDSAEYANIVLSFSRFYGQARAAGMRRPAQLGLLRDWVRRVLSGYWTHAGYLNWDTGLGFSRWHQRKKVGLAEQALIGVAAAPELQPGAQWGAWAKWMLDRGLLAYDAQVRGARALPAPIAFDVHVITQRASISDLAAARFEANAARALEAGLGHVPAHEPPALYSFDPDSGRLAVTTAAYNTAIIAANQHAFPYGGLDLARLYDADQAVAANIGGTGIAGFGLTVHAHGQNLRTQYGGRDYTPAGTPLRLVRAPLGVGASTQRRAFAGPFTDLRVRGTVRAGALTATSAYRFTPGWIDARWTLRGARTGTVTFPSWGSGASVSATLADGRTVALGTRALRGVRVLRVSSERSGYRVVLRGAGAVRLVKVRPQSSEPDPGPTVAVRIARTLLARITVG